MINENQLPMATTLLISSVLRILSVLEFWNLEFAQKSAPGFPEVEQSTLRGSFGPAPANTKTHSLWLFVCCFLMP